MDKIRKWFGIEKYVRIKKEEDKLFIVDEDGKKERVNKEDSDKINDLPTTENEEIDFIKAEKEDKIRWNL